MRVCQENNPCSLLSAQFSLSVSPSLSNKDTVLTTTLLFAHPSQDNACSAVEHSSHASLCCMCPYETKLKQLEKFKYCFLTHHGNLQQKTSLLLDKVAQCLLPLEEEHFRRRWEISLAQQPQEISVHCRQLGPAEQSVLN